MPGVMVNLINNAGQINIPGLGTSSVVYTDANRNLTTTAPTSGIAAFWQRTTNSLAPAYVTDDLNIGSTATSSAFFNVSGLTTTTGNAVTISGTNTTLTSGRLLSLDWSPTSVATASGDLFRINIGAAGDTTGNLFNITSAGSSLFSVSETAVTSNLPTSFMSAGDTSMAYELYLLPTKPHPKSYLMDLFSVASGEAYESNNLTLKTYNSGKVVILDTIRNSEVLQILLLGSTGILVYFQLMEPQLANALVQSLMKQVIRIF